MDKIVAAHVIAVQKVIHPSAYGARFDRNRIQTDVSTNTLMRPNAAPRKTAHAVDGCREHRLRTAKRAKTLVGGTADQRLETEPNGVGVCRGARRRFGLA